MNNILLHYQYHFLYSIFPLKDRIMYHFVNILKVALLYLLLLYTYSYQKGLLQY